MTWHAKLTWLPAQELALSVRALPDCPLFHHLEALTTSSLCTGARMETFHLPKADDDIKPQHPWTSLQFMQISYNYSSVASLIIPTSTLPFSLTSGYMLQLSCNLCHTREWAWTGSLPWNNQCCHSRSFLVGRNSRWYPSSWSPWPYLQLRQ